ncbi:uncharacterized protein B0J16DRAFT_383740 [Fusarium flagelliforme]|uniref:uncharacterized protein n=1 Tax=Fusarium flagelliforme TaxID=2675880 RepID=UPI001E8E5E4F|nr:uncharacterized protein B0J16DRAFT_383740 [Fusarium flagelliforme]KAH7184687.1 hypothetical protein B0J16DRAFT_383740 [Fusarium flagelliforme]
MPTSTDKSSVDITVSAVKKTTAQQDAETGKRANDSLTSLKDPEKLQGELLQLIVRDDKDPHKLSINGTMWADTLVRCGVDMQGDGIASEIKQRYGQWAVGQTTMGIKSAISNSLKALFNTTTGNSNQTSKYFIVGGEIGMPLRIDVLLYTYAFTSEELAKVTKNVVVVSTVSSGIDVASLNESVLRSQVSFCYGDANEEMQKGILDQLMSACTENEINELAIHEL